MNSVIVMRQRINKLIKEEGRYVEIVTIIGIIAHGFMLFNKFSLNDDNDCWFRLGITWPQGRWLLGILEEIAKKLGTRYFSTPWFNGIISIIIIAIASLLVCKILDISSFTLKILIGAVMECVVEVAAIFGFMFTSWAYSLALLLSVSAAYVWGKSIESKKGRWGHLVMGALLLACSLGLYQGFLSVNLCLMCLHYINMIIQKGQIQTKLAIHGVLCEFCGGGYIS